MSFNADAYRQAVRPWVFTVGGRSWTARQVSAPAVQGFYEALRARVGNPAEQERALVALLRLAFPWRLSFYWRGDPVRLLCALPPDARAEALQDFFGFLEGKARRPLPPPPTTPSGIASSPSSPTTAPA